MYPGKCLTLDHKMIWAAAFGVHFLGGSPHRDEARGKISCRLFERCLIAGAVPSIGVGRS